MLFIGELGPHHGGAAVGVLICAAEFLLIFTIAVWARGYFFVTLSFGTEVVGFLPVPARMYHAGAR